MTAEGGGGDGDGGDRTGRAPPGGGGEGEGGGRDAITGGCAVWCRSTMSEHAMRAPEWS